VRNHQNVRRCGHHADRREVADRVPSELVEQALIRHQRDRVQDDRVTVRSRARRGLHADVAGGAAAVVDDDPRAELAAERPVVQAQSYPAKPVRLIEPYPAGGATDFFARTVFTKMSESLGQQVVVENRPGAGTAIGASEVARSAPDGYTLLLGDAGTYAFNPTLYRKLSYDPVKDFAPVSLTGRFALILAVNPAVQTTSVQEFVAAAKRSPGAIDYGAPGPGSPIHLAMEFFKQRADII